MTTAAEQALLAALRQPATIRQRADALYQRALAFESRCFRLDLAQLDAAAEAVLADLHQHYPNLDVPYHSRWRHFSCGGVDRWRELAAQAAGGDAVEWGRRQVELAIISVLLDAGAGAQWHYRDRDGGLYTRSEGLAVASLRLYQQGLFSAAADEPLRVDAHRLVELRDEALAYGFQVDANNPLVGLGGRLALLHNLGQSLLAQPHLFSGPAPRLGQFFDHLAAQAQANTLAAPAILAAVLQTFGAIWPGRTTLFGVNLGDVWPHPALSAAATHPGEGLVPFHKLSQWLSYSLVEPLESAGISVVELDGLTGLPEYRNGGLFIDTGVLIPLLPGWADQAWPVDSELIVEWRALTVALLDRLAVRLRERLGLDQHTLPLAKVLQGGSWSAGRRLAQRRGGEPPLRIISDGTVF